ncbi:MAG: hypothetical protein CM1200mP14_03230 [Gammaproteobacteria bacterium]|nr:MAG: hypothetical protein CM1200mP14_03230 [Gammaproteobacteria bacterium]
MVRVAADGIRWNANYRVHGDINGLDRNRTGMLGLTLGPITGQMIAREILDPDAPKLRKLSPDRFRDPH